MVLQDLVDEAAKNLALDGAIRENIMDGILHNPADRQGFPILSVGTAGLTKLSTP